MTVMFTARKALGLALSCALLAASLPPEASCALAARSAPHGGMPSGKVPAARLLLLLNQARTLSPRLSLRASPDGTLSLSPPRGPDGKASARANLFKRKLAAAAEAAPATAEAAPATAGMLPSLGPKATLRAVRKALAKYRAEEIAGWAPEKTAEVAERILAALQGAQLRRQDSVHAPISATFPVLGPSFRLVPVKAPGSVDEAAAESVPPVAVRVPSDAPRDFAPWRALKGFFLHGSPTGLGTPLTRASHPTLAALSFLAGAAPIPLLAALLSKSAFALALPPAGIVSVFFLTIAFSALGEGKGARRAVLNARRYRMAPWRTSLSRTSLRFLREFESKTGWKADIISHPHLLARADPATRTLSLNVGWLASETPARDVRRSQALDKLLKNLEGRLRERETLPIEHARDLHLRESLSRLFLSVFPGALVLSLFEGRPLVFAALMAAWIVLAVHNGLALRRDRALLAGHPLGPVALRQARPPRKARIALLAAEIALSALPLALGFPYLFGGRFIPLTADFELFWLSIYMLASALGLLWLLLSLQPKIAFRPFLGFAGLLPPRSRSILRLLKYPGLAALGALAFLSSSLALFPRIAPHRETVNEFVERRVLEEEYLHPERPKDTALKPLEHVESSRSARRSQDENLERDIRRALLFLLEGQDRSGTWSNPRQEAPWRNYDGLRVPITAIILRTLEKEAPEGHRDAVRRGADFVRRNMLKDYSALIKEGQNKIGNNLAPYGLAYGLKLLLNQHAAQTSPQGRADYAAAIGQVLDWCAFSGQWYTSPNFILFGSESAGTFELALFAESLLEAKARGFAMPPARHGEERMEFDGWGGIHHGRENILEFTLRRLESQRLPYGGFPYTTTDSLLESLFAGILPPEESMARDVIIEYVLYQAGRSDKGKLRDALTRYFNSLPTLIRVVDNPELRGYHDQANRNYAKYFYLISMNYAAKILRELAPESPFSGRVAWLLSLSLRARQAEDGSFMDSKVTGPYYGTAMAIDTLRILQDVMEPAGAAAGK